MLSSIGLWIIGFAINYAHTFRVIAFKWDNLSRRISLPLSRWDLSSCRLNYYLLWLHELFIVTRFVESILEGRILPLHVAIMDLTYIIMFLFPCVFQFLLRDKTSETVTFINQYTSYLLELQANYPLRTSSRPKNWEVLMVLFALFAIIQPFMYFSICFRRPAIAPLFLSSILDTWVGTQSAFLDLAVFLLASIDAWCFVVSCSYIYFIVCVMIVYLFTAVELLQKISSFLESRTFVQYIVDDVAAWAVDSIHLFRCFQLLTNDINFIVRDCIYIGEICALSFFVFQAFILGQHWRVLNLPYIFIYTLGLLAATPYLLVSNDVLASYNENSLRFLRSFSTCTSTLPVDRALFERYIRSCRPCRIEMGHFGHFDQKKKIRMHSGPG